MKNRLILSFFFLSIVLAGCIVDVVEQSTERWAYGSGAGVVSVYFDASIFRQIFTVEGSAADTLIADGIFSLWAPGSSTASSIAQNVSMFWSIDTLHRGELVAFAQGPEKELVSIDKMTATIPAKSNLKVNASSTDVSIQNMKGDLEINGNISNITFTTEGRMSQIQTTSGKITGSTGLGGSVGSGSGDIIINLTSPGFESIFASDTTGNVFIHVPAKVGVTFKLQTNGGKITVSYDNYSDASSSAINHPVNGGGKVVFVATGTGNITVSN